MVLKFVEEQAIDRVHRIGQTSDVMVYRMTISNTIESRIVELQDRKRKIADAAFGSGGDLFKKGETAKLTRKDLLFLFNKDAERLHTNDDDDLAIALGNKMSVMDHGMSTRDQDVYSMESMARTSGKSSRQGGSSKPRPERRPDHEVFGRR